jgi:hypothetical protein
LGYGNYVADRSKSPWLASCGRICRFAAAGIVTVAEGPRRSATDKGGLFPLTYRWRKAMPKVSGGCLCGAVRYECNAEPLGTAICHCTHCQKVSGSAFSVNVVVPAPSLTWQGQSLASYADKGESGKPLSRKFCRNCGSSLATETEALPGAIIIKAGTLDDKSWLKPNYHIWTNSAQPWVRIEPGATTFSKGRT